MTNETQLIYPTLDLFLYDLRKGLGQNDDKLKQKRRNFWQKVYGKSLDDKLLEDLAKAEKEGASFVHLHKENNGYIDFLDPTLDGYYYPLQLGDMFALQVDCSGNYADDKNTPNDNPQPISNLSKIKKEINNQIQGNIQGTIGQTWIMYAQLSENCTTNQMKKVAQQCYQELEPNGNWESDFYTQGKFLGANVFEFWRFSNNSEDTHHLLIWLFPNTNQIQLIRDNIADIYVDLMRLFAYRHKMVWAYQQSQTAKNAVENDYQKIRGCVDAIVQMNRDENLGKVDLDFLEKNLKTSLNILSHYAIDLSQFKAQGGTIRVNLSNYEERLKQLTNKDSSHDKNLSFLSNFGEFAKVRYQEQITEDYDNLSPGLTLLENLIRTIEGIINIEQTKSDRALSMTVGVASAGLAASGVTATVVSTQVYSPQNNQNTMSLLSGIWWSIGIPFGVVASAIIFFSIPWLFRRRSK